jgi:hypothetical protein
MKKNLAIALGAIFAVAGLAYAQARIYDLITARAQVYEVPVHIGPRGLVAPPSTANRLTRVLGASVSNYADNVDGGQAFTNCVSRAVTLTGARVGDACLASVGGSILADAGVNFSVICRVTAANQVTLVTCPAGGLTTFVPTAGSVAVEVFSNL